MSKLEKIGTKQVAVYRIVVDVLENEQDYEFVFIDRGNGVKGMAVF